MELDLHTIDVVPQSTPMLEVISMLRRALFISAFAVAIAGLITEPSTLFAAIATSKIANITGGYNTTHAAGLGANW